MILKQRKFFQILIKMGLADKSSIPEEPTSWDLFNSIREQVHAKSDWYKATNAYPSNNFPVFELDDDL